LIPDYSLLKLYVNPIDDMNGWVTPVMGTFRGKERRRKRRPKDGHGAPAARSRRSNWRSPFAFLSVLSSIIGVKETRQGRGPFACEQSARIVVEGGENAGAEIAGDTLPQPVRLYQSKTLFRPKRREIFVPGQEPKRRNSSAISSGERHRGERFKSI
jgi:hypothetical protein